MPVNATGNDAGPGTGRSADELARAAAAGDRAALEELLRAIQPQVQRRVSRFLPNRQDAEEAAQDALLTVARRIGTFEGRSAFTTWLYTVVTNSARQTYRDLKRRAAEQPVADGPPERPDPRTTSVIAGSRLDLLEALEKLEAEAPQLVEPLVYRDVYGLDYDDIADRLGVPLGTVKSRIHSARQRVQPWLTTRDG